MTALRVWHLSPDAPNVEAASGYLMVPGGRYAVRVNAAGTTTSVFAGRLTLRAGRAYTAAALGAVEAEGRPVPRQALHRRDRTSPRARGGRARGLNDGRGRGVIASP
jgi:hypothetical protein